MGSLDIPASQDKLKEAGELGLELQAIQFSLIISSPLSRAQMTAQSIFPGRKIKIDKRLRERGLGTWAGCSKKEIRDKYPEAFLPSGFIDPYFTPEKGELIEKVVSRVRGFIRDMVKMGEDDHVVAITHNGVIRIIRCIIENHPLLDIFTEAEPHLAPRSYSFVNNIWAPISLNSSFDEV
jgi:probable phosphoglycerate mutase